MSGTCVVPYQAKRKPEMKSAIDDSIEIIPPVDFSFCSLEHIADANEEDPRPPVSPRKGKQPVQQEGSKSSGRCLRLNNNSITNLECLKAFVQIKFSDWQNVAWIDLSHNELTKIGPELTEFENLQILYLHGNAIQDPAQIDQLIPLKSLRKLTLHGNPMEITKGYRWLVLSKLPQLRYFDFSLVTKAERKTSGTWERMNSWGLQKKKKVEDDD